MDLLPRLQHRQVAASQNQMIPKWRPSAPRSWPPTFFGPIVNWITFTRVLLGQGGVHRMAQANFNVRGLARSLGVILRRRPCFLRLVGGGAAARPVWKKTLVGLSKAKKSPRCENTPRPLDSQRLDACANR